MGSNPVRSRYGIAKSTPRPVTAPTVARTALLERLSEHRHAQVVSVLAPTGYGKTTLLQQWLRRLVQDGATPASIALDAGDGDAQLFLSRVLQALDDASLPTAGDLRDLVDDGASPVAVSTTLAASFVNAQMSFYLVLDNCHHLRGSPAAECVAAMIEHASDELHIVLAGRGAPPVALGRLRAQGRVFEIHTSELAFTLKETEAMLGRFAGAGGVPAAACIEQLHARSEGWPAGLRLAALNLGDALGSDRAADLLSGEAADVDALFREEVLAGLPAELREFLFHTALCDSFSADLCTALTDVDDAFAMITQCEAHGIFIAPVDRARSWWRYHTLFSEFLRRDLRMRAPAAVAALHLRAAAWFEKAGLYLKAAEHAIEANDARLAASILDINEDVLVRTGKLREMAALALRIPQAILKEFPRVSLYLLEWHFLGPLAPQKITMDMVNHAAELLRLVESVISSDAFTQGKDPTHLQTLKLRVICVQMLLAWREYRIPEIETYRSAALLVRNDISPVYGGRIHSTLLAANSEQFKFRNLESAESQARRMVGRMGETQPLILLETIIAQSNFMCGRTAKAAESLENAMQTALLLDEGAATLASIPALSLAEIYYERNETKRAKELIDVYLEHSTTVFNFDQFVPAYITQARLLRLDGDFGGAQARLTEALAFAAINSFEKLRVCATADLIRLLLEKGELDEAQYLGRELGLKPEANCVVPAGSVTFCDSKRACAWVRLAVARNDTVNALAITKQWRSYLASSHATRAVLEWDMLRCRIHLMTGEPRVAYRRFTAALSLASNGRFVRTILDETGSLAALFKQLASDPVPSDNSAAFVSEIVALANAERDDLGGEPALSPDRNDGIADPLTIREIEILTMAAQAMSNRLIGERLGLTEGSVKWYLQQIFDKLYVRRRYEAVAKARRLGIVR